MPRMQRRETPSPLSAGSQVRRVRPRPLSSMRMVWADGCTWPRLSPEQRVIAGRLVIAAGCAYELVSLVHPKVPTISELVYRASNHKVLRFAAWCFGGYALDHFFGSD